MSDPLDVALEAVAAAGAELLSVRRPRAQSKTTAIDLVTEWDRRSEERIVAALRAAFPDDQILAEESGLSGAPAARRWFLDPIDGTTNFAHGLPLWCISLARESDGAIDVAVVHAPALGMTYRARRGGGAFCNDERLAVSEGGDLGAALLVTGFPYDRHTSDDNNFDQFIAFQRRAQGVRRLGAAALDLALVARGALDGYWEMKLKPWDLAAGMLLVEEAGGVVTDWRGGPVRLDRGAVVAANRALHPRLVEVLGTLPLPAAAI